MLGMARARCGTVADDFACHAMAIASQPADAGRRWPVCATLLFAFSFALALWLVLAGAVYELV